MATGLLVLAAISGLVGHANAQTSFITSGKVIKWDQPPALANPTNVFYGWNEPSVIGMQVAADDWVCTTTNPVMKIRWWGSFKGWTASDATPVLPFRFRIDFWTDQPAGPGNPFSHPLQAIWQIVTTNYTWKCAGQDYDPRTGTFETCFLFEADLSPQDWFYQNPLTGTNIYWLSIAADYAVGVPVNTFGWKTRPRSPTSLAPDSAVDILNPNNPVPGSLFITGVPIAYAALSNQWDLAFELITAGPGVAKWEQLPDLTVKGTDVNATQPPQQPAPPPPYLLADDFLCVTPGFITNIVIWGSWLNDILPMIPAGGLPNANNVTFILSFHDDIPATQSLTGYSMPGPVRRVFSFVPGSFFHTVLASNIQEGFLNPPAGFIFPGDTVCHQYEFPIGFNLDPFFQDGTAANPKVFWLDVQAIPASTNAHFGWKSSFTNWNDAGVWANAAEPFGGLWNKLIFPPTHPRGGTNIDLAFRINTGAIPSDLVKWSQPPVPAANPGNWYNGWNEPSIDGGGIWNNTPLTNIVADDWLCTNARPVTDIHWWGSFLNWTGTNAPPQPPVAFRLAIWKDVPQGPNTPFSHPGQVLWDYIVSTTDPTLGKQWVGWDFDPRDPCLQIESCFKFDYSLPGTNFWFFQQPGTNTYWLSIAAIYPGGNVGQNPFGWKTRPHVPVPPDDAVRIFEPLIATPGLNFVRGQPIEFPSGTSWDMAFRLTTCQPYPVTNVVFTNISATSNILGNQIITVRWNAQPGAVYQLQETTDLNPFPLTWTDVGLPVVGPANTITFTNPAVYFHRFYRLNLPDICP